MMNQTLPPLTSPDMPAVLLEDAETDRSDKLAQLERFLRKQAGNTSGNVADEMVQLYREVAIRQTDARWWLGSLANVEKLAREIQGMFTADDKARLKALAANR